MSVAVALFLLAGLSSLPNTASAEVSSGKAGASIKRDPVLIKNGHKVKSNNIDGCTGTATARISQWNRSVTVPADTSPATASFDLNTKTLYWDCPNGNQVRKVKPYDHQACVVKKDSRDPSEAIKWVFEPNYLTKDPDNYDFLWHQNFVDWNGHGSDGDKRCNMEYIPLSTQIWFRMPQTPQWRQYFKLIRSGGGFPADEGNFAASGDSYRDFKPAEDPEYLP